MPYKSALLEPSFVEAIAAIEQAADLSKSTMRHWVCSLRQIGKWLDRPLEVIPARWTSIRLPVGQLHHARLDVTAKTVSGLVSRHSRQPAPLGSHHSLHSG